MNQVELKDTVKNHSIQRKILGNGVVDLGDKNDAITNLRTALNEQFGGRGCSCKQCVYLG